MTKIGSKTSFILGLTLFASLVFAQDGIIVQSDIDRDRVEVGETFTVTITVQSSESVSVEQPHLPTLTGLELMQQWDNTSVQQSLTQGANGMDWKTVRKQQYHFMFKTKATGRFSVDAFEVVVNGKLFQTRPLLVEVMPEGSGGGSPQGGGQGGGIPGFDEEEEKMLKEQEEIFNQLLRRQMPQLPGFNIPRGNNQGGAQQRQNQPEPEYRSMPSNPNEAFFIQLEVDKKTVFEGEQITASWYLLTRGQMETLDRVKFPALKGFWKEIIEENPQIQFTEEVINGVAYRKALLASHALFPIKTGKTVIDEFTVKSRVRMPMQGFGFGFGRAYEFTKSSKRLDIDVKPLPTEGRPPQFTGAVGQFEVSAQVVQQPQFAVSQPFSVKVRFEGQGNAKAIELPAIEWPAGLELYDTKNESRYFKDGRSYKEYEILLIPRKEGPLEIPPVQFAFFNPQTQKYELKKTDAIKLDIKPAAPGTENNQGGSFLGENKKAAPVLSMPPVIPTLEANSVAATHNIWPFAFLFNILGLFAFAWKELRNQNKSVSLRKKLDAQWKKVEKAISDNSPRQVGTEIVNACNLVLSEIASHRGDVLEIHKMIEKLPPDLRSQYAVLIVEFYEKAQALGFAPDEVVKQMSQTESYQAMIKKSRQVLNDLCASWKAGN